MQTERKRMTGEARKESILSAACELFAEIGYDKTSTKQLARRANCSEALIYKYFDSKQAIMDALLEEWKLIQNRESKLDIVNDSAIETLRRHYETFMLATKDEPIESSSGHFRPHLLAALHSTPVYYQKTQKAFMEGSDMFQNTMIPIIQYGQKKGEIAQGDAAEMANLFVCYMIGAREIFRKFPKRFTPLDFDVLAERFFK